MQDRYRPAITPELLDRAFQERRNGRGAPDAFDTVLDLYRASPEFTALSANTKREYRLRLDQISARMGKAPIRLLNGKDARAEIISWRDELSGTPRAADRVVGMLSTVLNWAMELALTWESVQPAYIALETAQTGGEAVIPMHSEVKAFLKPRGKGVILRNSNGDPWTPDGFQSSWRKARPEGFDRHPHDLRGTFATGLAIAGFSDGEIADALGWTAERVASIRARYVDRTRVAKARARKLSA